MASRFDNHRRVLLNTIKKTFGRSVVAVSAMALACSLAKAEEANPSAQYKTVDNILYREGKLTEYMQERCRLDVYHPVGKEGYPTIVWFHGGGLKAGNRSVPSALKNKGVAVVSVNYRLHPKVSRRFTSKMPPPRSPGRSRTSPSTEVHPAVSLSVAIQLEVILRA